MQQHGLLLDVSSLSENESEFQNGLNDWNAVLLQSCCFFFCFSGNIISKIAKILLILADQIPTFATLK